MWYDFGMIDVLSENALPRLFEPKDLLHDFRSLGRKVVEDGEVRYLEGLYHRVDDRGRVIFPKTKDAPRRASLWRFMVVPQYAEDEDAQSQPVGAVFEAYKFDGIEHKAPLRAYSFSEIEELAKEGGFVLIHPPRSKGVGDISPEVVLHGARNLYGDELRRKEREATSKSLRALTTELIKNRLDVIEGSGDTPDTLADRITDAELVNEILRTARLPLDQKRYENLKSKQERPGAGAFYLMRSDQMLREPGAVITDVEKAKKKVVPTLIVRVRSRDQHMGADTLTPPYLATTRDQDIELTPREIHATELEIGKAYREEKVSLYALASLRKQIEDLQDVRKEAKLRATLRAQKFEQIRLELEEWRDRSGELYKMITPVVIIKLEK